MVIAFSTFLISLILIGTLIANKVFELEKGRALISFHRSADHKVKKVAFQVKTIAKHAPKEIGRIVLYFLIKKGVEISDKIKKRIHPRISHIIDAVKGRDVPKKKGNASSFLEKIGSDLGKKDTEI